MIWFDKDHPQTVALKTYTVLVGKAPTKAKRIRMAFTLDLTSGEVKGLPEWMMDARDFVMKTKQTVTEKLVIHGISITMGDPNLFKKKPVEAPSATIRKLVVFSAGDSEDPDTLVSFIAYAQFSTDLNRWCGQMAGEEFTATFEGVTPEPGDTLTLNPQSAADDDDEEEDLIDDDEDDEDEEDAKSEAGVSESQSARAERIARAAKENAAKATPAARGPISFTKSKPN
jgi:hypothetical protein